MTRAQCVDVGLGSVMGPVGSQPMSGLKCRSQASVSFFENKL